jgi:hypothetical protein
MKALPHPELNCLRGRITPRMTFQIPPGKIHFNPPRQVLGNSPLELHPGFDPRGKGEDYEQTP